MEFCIQSKIAILLCIISLMFNISTDGLNLGMVFIELIIDIIFVSIVNWLCFKEGFNTIAWIFVVISAIFIFVGIILVRIYGKELENAPLLTIPSLKVTSTMNPPAPTISSIRTLLDNSISAPS